MPKEIINDDGETEIVYSKEEVEGLEKGAQKNKERKQTLSDLAKEVGAEDPNNIKDKLGELKETANPNFAKYRKKFNTLEKIAKDKGYVVDENGEVVDGNKPITAEQIQKQTEEAVNRALSTKERESALSQYKDDDRKLVEHYLDKLMSTGGTLEENLKLAEVKAFPGGEVDKAKQIYNSASGGVPRTTKPNSKGFSESEEGKALLKNLMPKGYEPK